MIPAQSLPNSSPAAKKLFDRLKRRLPSEYVVIQPFAERDHPDFLVISPDNKAVFLVASALIQQDVRELGELVSADFREQIVITQTRQLVQDAIQIPVPTILVFPYLRQREIPARLTEAVTCFDKQMMRELGRLLPAQVSRALMSEQVARLRAAFTPEIVVPPTMTTRQPERNTDATLTPFLLDFEQEKALKTDLKLRRRQRKAHATLAFGLSTAWRAAASRSF